MNDWALTSPRREASLFTLPGPYEARLFYVLSNVLSLSRRNPGRAAN